MTAKAFFQVICLTIVLGALTSVNGAVAEQPRDGVFIHVSHGSDDPHRVLMALSMASLKDGDDLTYSHFPSSKTQLAALPKKGVILMACPGCLKAADKTAADLAPGIQIADKDRFFSFTKGRILTLDY